MGVERLYTTDLRNLRLSESEGSTTSQPQRKPLRRQSSIPEIGPPQAGTSLTHVRNPLRRVSSEPESSARDVGPSCLRGLPNPRPKKTGVVSMVHPTPSGVNVKLRVRLTVHDTYAVVSPDKEVTRDMGYVNLRRSSVERINTNAFQIVPQDCDANALTFYVNQEKDLIDWIDSLQSNEKTSTLLRRPYTANRGPTRRWSAPVGTFMPVIEED